ncbi:MAG: CDGSH iron-sulfur domain-containing protein [Actinomycetota bacterium]
MADDRPPHIEVLPHGPYEVTGDVPLRPRRAVNSPTGRPITWQTDEAIDHEATYYLCRCGASENKPFCDGSHGFELFDGTEDAPTDTHAERAVYHEGPGTTVVQDSVLCHHAKFCFSEVHGWIDMVADTDDPSIQRELIAMIEHCPSGALAQMFAGELVEPDLPAGISPIEDGPLAVTGGIAVERADGAPFETRNRVSLCRCGASERKPLCDGSHITTNFRASP